MTSLWVPAPEPAQVLTEPNLPDSPFHPLLGLTRMRLRDTREIPAGERRLLLPNFVATFRWAAVWPLLPLRLVVAPTQPAAGQDQPPTPPLWQPRHPVPPTPTTYQPQASPPRLSRQASSPLGPRPCPDLLRIGHPRTAGRHPNHLYNP